VGRGVAEADRAFGLKDAPVDAAELLSGFCVAAALWVAGPLAAEEMHCDAIH